MCDGENNIVVGSICGGLGNQLFTIAAILHYGKLVNKKVCFIRVTSSPSVLFKRSVYWDNLFVGLETKVIKDPDDKKIKKYSDFKHGYKSIPLLEDINWIEGLFQSPKYFDLVEIRETLFPKIYFEKTIVLLKEKSYKPWAFMHFRRGDYKKLRHTHNVLPISYYEQASNHFPFPIKFLIFCELEDQKDIEQEIKQSLILKKREYEFIDSTIPDHLQLLMMAQCTDGGIIANSSFSVWAAYLQPKYNTIIAPKQWFTNIQESNQTNLCLSSWTTL